MIARLLAAAKTYATSYVQDEAESEDDCVCGAEQHAAAVELFAAIQEVELAAATASVGTQQAVAGDDRAQDEADALADLRGAVIAGVSDDWLLGLVRQYPFPSRAALSAPVAQAGMHGGARGAVLGAENGAQPLPKGDHGGAEPAQVGALTDAQILVIYQLAFESTPGCARAAPSKLPPLVFDFARAILASQQQDRRDPGRLISPSGLPERRKESAP